MTHPTHGASRHPHRAASLAAVSLLALAAALTGCERRGTDPQTPSTTPSTTTPPATTTPSAEPAMPPASAASQ